MSLNNGETDSELHVVRWLCLCANITECKYTKQTKMITISLSDIALQTVKHIVHRQLKNHYVVYDCVCLYIKAKQLSERKIIYGKSYGRWLS